MVDCPTCTHVLVTNGDNSYHPDFLVTALKEQRDLVITDFLSQGKLVDSDFKLARLDLGGVLLDKKVFKDGQRSFLNSLPQKAIAKDVHDADWWFVQKSVQEYGASYALVHQTLFYHH